MSVTRISKANILFGIGLKMTMTIIMHMSLQLFCCECVLSSSHSFLVKNVCADFTVHGAARAGTGEEPRERQIWTIITQMSWQLSHGTVTRNFLVYSGYSRRFVIVMVKRN